MESKCCCYILSNSSIFPLFISVNLLCRVKLAVNREKQEAVAVKTVLIRDPTVAANTKKEV